MRTDDDFERFYLGSRRRLVGLLYTVTGDLHEAEDITQEAFARAAADWSRISGYDVPEAWVRRVAFNLAANRRRRRSATRPRCCDWAARRTSSPAGSRTWPWSTRSAPSRSASARPW
jgi:DNA-directed RNA polymerase specialized sigma24 family protein